MFRWLRRRKRGIVDIIPVDDWPDGGAERLCALDANSSFHVTPHGRFVVVWSRD